MTLYLDSQPIGSRVIVIGIEGDDDLGIRLMEMGIVPETELQIIGVAPLGDPLEIELRGYRLSLRREEAKRIAITRI